MFIYFRHAGLSDTEIKFMAAPLDSLLKLPLKDPDSPLPYGTGEEQIMHIHRLAIQDTCNF